MLDYKRLAVPLAILIVLVVLLVAMTLQLKYI